MRIDIKHDRSMSTGIFTTAIIVVSYEYMSNVVLKMKASLFSKELLELSEVNKQLFLCYATYIQQRHIAKNKSYHTRIQEHNALNVLSAL